MITSYETLAKSYHGHLGSPHPRKTDGSLVSGSKIRAQLLLAGEQFAAQSAQWAPFFNAWEQNPERIYIWSDLHVSHKNICKYAERPFDSTYRMNDVMLQNAKQLTEDDILLFLGDLSFDTPENTKDWMAQIPCPKYSVLGNHDVDRKGKLATCLDVFDGISDCLFLKKDERDLLLTHYPLSEKLILENATNIHGHIHQNLIPGRYLNVSVEQQNYEPKRLLDLVNALEPLPAKVRRPR